METADRVGEHVLDTGPGGHFHTTIWDGNPEIGLYGKHVAARRIKMDPRGRVRRHRDPAGRDEIDEVIRVADRREVDVGVDVPHGVDDVSRAPTRVDPVERGDDRITGVRVDDSVVWILAIEPF